MEAFYRRIVTGLGVGSFVYLLILLMSDEKSVTTSSIIFTFFISISAGLSSFIFDVERFSFLTCLLIHYLIINVVVIVGSYCLISVTSYFDLLVSVLVIYALSYLVTYLKMRGTSKEVNQLVKEIQKEENQDMVR